MCWRNITISAQKKTRVNKEITAQDIRVIADNGDQIGVMSRSEALQAAKDAGLDLVEVSPNAKPPVAIITDSGKYQYQQKKKGQAKVKKTSVLKKIQFRPVTEQDAVTFKVRNIVRFLKHGNKVKVSVRFRGREMAHQDLGYELLQQVIKEADDNGLVEQAPKLEGREINMVLAPKKVAA